MTHKTIVICGNHHSPAVELIRQLRADIKIKWQIFYITSPLSYPQHLQHSILPLVGRNFIPLHSPKINRHRLFSSFLSLYHLLPAITQTSRQLAKIKPDIVVSFGGYSSVPIIIAAWIQKIPSISHEQTTTLSLSSKINGFFCRTLATSFPPPPSLISRLFAHKTIITGNLLRHEIFLTGHPPIPRLTTQITRHPLIFVTGGGQGSQFLNQLVPEIIPQLQNYTIIHQTGSIDQSQTQILDSLSHLHPNYHHLSFISSRHIGWTLNHARVIISRSGANFTQECLSLQKSTILIPHPKTQQNEQLLNAQYLQQQLPRQTIIIPQSQVTPDKVISAIRHLLSLPTSKSIGQAASHINFRLYEAILSLTP